MCINSAVGQPKRKTSKPNLDEILKAKIPGSEPAAITVKKFATFLSIRAMYTGKPYSPKTIPPKRKPNNVPLIRKLNTLMYSKDGYTSIIPAKVLPTTHPRKSPSKPLEYNFEYFTDSFICYTNAEHNCKTLFCFVCYCVLFLAS